MKEPTGFVSIVLHGHLPFIRHPEHDPFLEENWLFEAITDCYIPLLDVFNGLERDGVPGRLAMSLTPPLLAMLNDELLLRRYERHLHGLIELADRERDRTRHHPDLNRLAQMYFDRFRHTLHAFTETYRRDVAGAFRALQDAGRLELIASAATHAFLPLLHPRRAGVEVQIDVGIEAYRRAFGREPEGFWLPECGLEPDFLPLLAKRGVRWVVAESHGVLHARPRPRRGVYAPVQWPGVEGAAGTASSSVAVFPRDVESSKQVWSATEGYPGDFDYRDFYRDIGYDLDYDYVRPWLKSDERGLIGIKYYRITGTGDHKELYNPDAAAEKAALHAGNFMFNRQQQVRHLRRRMDRPPLIVAPYDAELFGHWWFEGPRWLDVLVRKIAYDQSDVSLVAPSDYLAIRPDVETACPSPSSWGYGGFNKVWLNEANDWIYRHTHHLEERLLSFSLHIDDPPPVVRRALNQAVRELLLAQSSDWAFIMATDTHVPYAVRRTREHIARCLDLCRQIEAGAVDEERLRRAEAQYNVFPWLDYTVWRRTGAAARSAGRAPSEPAPASTLRRPPVSV